MSSSSVIEIDRGYRALLKQVNATPVKLKVGVLTDEAHADAPGKTVAQIAEIHELGLGVPPRPWLRPVVDGQRALIQQRIERIAQESVKGRITPRQGFEQLGLWLVGVIQARIRAGIPPKLADSTKARKTNTAGQHKDTPLINTSQFIGSITYQVTGGNARKTAFSKSVEKAKKAAVKSVSRAVRVVNKSATQGKRVLKKNAKKLTKAARKNVKKTIKKARSGIKRALKKKGRRK